MKLGVCYYPEHWPTSRWRTDAEQMKKIGIEYVRVGEFSWSTIEPTPEQMNWQWLDESLDILHEYGLKVILGTPTATPPKWLVDRNPGMLAKDEQGRERGFGSRRHYTFASLEYREECRRIVTIMAQRYGQHPAVVSWQTDNEFGCHDTILSYADADLTAFRLWLKDKYGTIEALNQAWGNVFWSMEYRSFDEIELPNLTVTEANPSHRLDFQRCSSDQVVAYNKLQVDILREHSAGRDLVHNYMGFFTAFDHHKVGEDLDVASWDTYPLGFLDQEAIYTQAEKQTYLRVGHPDFGAFHHDLYRGCGKGRLWIMEQQPGPVNWAPHNPTPADGAVRLWTWEAFSHGAEMVSYFRWRQAPFAQEQMHAGLLRPDAEEAEAAKEASKVASEVEQLSQALGMDADELVSLPSAGKVALMFDYDACWSLDIQPQSRAYRYLFWCYRSYQALRELGLSVDIIPATASLDTYDMLVLPAQAHISADLNRRLDAYQGVLLAGPRTGSKTETYQIPENLAPGPLAERLPLQVERVDALPEHTQPAVSGRWGVGVLKHWHEQIKTDLPCLLKDHGGNPVLVGEGRHYYLGSCLDNSVLKASFAQLAGLAGLETYYLPEGLRIRERGELIFVMNYASHSIDFVPDGAELVIGSRRLEAANIAIWKKC
ncbi:beta-galactosidase [Marinomonas posidonica]|uniref:Beta-galactosidase n=1 Tax=Marinomonas posidonica (strain CECT 7376 / NCIMB 14433 / IVIA-Po-181) TaxID=491952 RepID=F6CRV8_MARPP|nr:beta-galactosidase [Marinomonas posidonica]AEF54961.1 Beta-galactosidase [Marinomonas posidonica IVIA-Po-181]